MADTKCRRVDVGWITRAYAAVPVILCWFCIVCVATFLFAHQPTEGDGIGIALFSVLALIFSIVGGAVAYCAQVDRDSVRWFARAVLGAIGSGFIVTVLVFAFIFLK